MLSGIWTMLFALEVGSDGGDFRVMDLAYCCEEFLWPLAK
jgi:hypothetical protein